MDDLVRAAGQRVLEQEYLERVQPLLEHREPRDERERDGGERHEAQNRGERKAARGAGEPRVPRAGHDVAHERGEALDRRQDLHRRLCVTGAPSQVRGDYPTRAEAAVRAAAFVVSLAVAADDPFVLVASRDFSESLRSPP